MAKIKPHFMKSIREIDSDIVALQDSITPIQNDIGRLLATRATIVELYGADTVILPAPGGPLTPALSPEGARVKKERAVPEAGAPKKRKYTKRAPAAAAAEEKPAGGGADGAGDAAPKRGGVGGRQPSPFTVKLLAAARVAPEPFTAAALHVVTGLDEKIIAKGLSNLAAVGKLNRVARGEYSRTKLFPAA